MTTKIITLLIIFSYPLLSSFCCGRADSFLSTQNPFFFLMVCLSLCLPWVWLSPLLPKKHWQGSPCPECSPSSPAQARLCPPLPPLSPPPAHTPGLRSQATWCQPLRGLGPALNFISSFFLCSRVFPTILATGAASSVTSRIHSYPRGAESSCKPHRKGPRSRPTGCPGPSPHRLWIPPGQVL